MTAKKSKINFSKIITILIISLLIFCLTLSLTGYLGKFHLYFELTSHFKVQYLGLSFILTILIAFLNYRKWVILGFFCISLNLVEVGYWYLPDTLPSTSTSRAEIKVLLSNIYANNQESESLIKLIKQENPQIFVIQEYTPFWHKALQEFEPQFPYFLKQSRDDSFGLAIYSKIPITASKIDYFSDSNIPSFFAEITMDDQSFELITFHPLPPINQEMFKLRNEQLQKIAQKIINSKFHNQKQVVIGDLNTSLWSFYYRQFAQKTNLKNTRKGFGILPTWQVDSLLFSIPIDHCLVSPSIPINHFKVGEDVYSDHRPIIATLSF